MTRFESPEVAVGVTPPRHAQPPRSLPRRGAGQQQHPLGGRGDGARRQGNNRHGGTAGQAAVHSPNSASSPVTIPSGRSPRLNPSTPSPPSRSPPSRSPQTVRCPPSRSPQPAVHSPRCPSTNPPSRSPDPRRSPSSSSTHGFRPVSSSSPRQQTSPPLSRSPRDGCGGGGLADGGPAYAGAKFSEPPSPSVLPPPPMHWVSGTAAGARKAAGVREESTAESPKISPAVVFLEERGGGVVGSPAATAALARALGARLPAREGSFAAYSPPPHAATYYSELTSQLKMLLKVQA